MKIICPAAGVTYPAQEERISSRRTSRGRIMYVLYRKKNYKKNKKRAGHDAKILDFGCITKRCGWVAKFVSRLRAKADLWVRIQTSLINTKWSTKEKSGQHKTSPPKK
jgi:hypothetical protein